MKKGYIVYGFTRGNRGIMYDDGGGYDMLVRCEVDYHNMAPLIQEIAPDEIYNLAAQTDATASMVLPEDTMDANSNIVLSLCEIVKNLPKPCKLFQAGSSEMYKGLSSTDGIQFYPKNIYGIAKLTAHWLCRFYREHHRCYIVNGIIYNTESPLRNSKYVSKKITEGVKKCLVDESYSLTMGNVWAKRDWIHAEDVAKAAYMSLRPLVVDDYDICLGRLHTVKEFIDEAFNRVGLPLEWNEGCTLASVGARVFVTVDETLHRDYEKGVVEPVVGDNRKLRRIGWEPTYTFEDIIDDLLR